MIPNVGVAGPNLGGTLSANTIVHPIGNDYAIRGIYAEYKSPLPWWTVYSFSRSHPDFDIEGFLTVCFCESDYGTIGKSKTYHNPGNIIARPASWPEYKVWWTWQSGTFESAGRFFAAYPNAYTGQRALIRLLYDHPAWYNHMLAQHRFEEFAETFYGKGVPGLEEYVADLWAAHNRIITQALRWGVVW
jgi:hypothetical protein